MILISIGKHINFEPIWIAINGTHVIVSSYTSFMTWQYSVPKSHSASIINSELLFYTYTLKSFNEQTISMYTFYFLIIFFFLVKRKKVKMFHIDDTPSGVDELTQESSEFKSSSFQKVNFFYSC